MKNKLAEIIGWIGTLMIIVAYITVSFGIISANSLIYQLLNLIGALGILIISLVKGVYQTVVTNLFWMIIALFALLKILKIV